MASFIACQFRYLFSHLTFLIQIDRSDVRSSIKSIESPQWETCKTWQQAIKIWELAYKNKTIFLVREEIWDKSAATRRLLTKTSTPRLHLEAPAAPRTLVSVADSSAPLVQMPASGTPTTSLSDSKKRFPSVIVISDSESDGKDDSDSDSEIEVTGPVKIEKKNDCFELTDDENGELSVRQTYDAVTDTHFDEPTTSYIPSQAKGSRMTSLSHSKTRTPTTFSMSGSGYESDSEPPSRGSGQVGSESKRLRSSSPSKPAIKPASGIARRSKKTKKV